MYESFLQHVVHPTVSLPSGFLSQVAQLGRLQWSSSEEMEARILKRLRFVVAYSYEHFRFCRERLDSVTLRPQDIRTLDDFRRIPTITKPVLSRCLDAEAVLTRRSGTLTSTGGTEGRPLVFLTSRDAGVAGIASKIFYDSWIGVGAHERKFSSRPYVRIRDRLLLNELEVTSATLVKRPEAAYRRLRSFRPKLVGGNAAIRVLASYMAERGLETGDPLSGAVVWGIPLLPEQVEVLSKAFCDNIYDRYGSAELSGIVGQECETKTGLHVNTELSLVEVLRDGEPCSEGERGRLVVTNLRNLATPFIRYEQGDSAVVLDDCACGRYMPLIAHIRGKDPSSMQMKSGVRIPRATLNSFVGHMEESRYIERFSFRKGSADDLVLSVQPKRGFNPPDAEKIHNKLTRTLGALTEISVQVLDDSWESEQVRD